VIAGDAVDRALFAATPLLPAPRFGVLPELEVGAKRFLGAAKGVFVEARSEAALARLQVARCALPYGDLCPLLRLAAGPVPKTLLRTFVERA